MITELPILKITRAHPYLTDDEDGTEELFNQSLNETAKFTSIDTPIYFNEIPAYARYYEFVLPSVDKNIVYDTTHNGRFHFLFKGLKYYPNISDLWYMNAMLIGYQGNTTNPILQKKVSGVSLQSFANINLGVDAISLAMQIATPVGKTINQGLFDSSEVGIRLVMFIDKLDLVERTVGGKKIKNLQFHFTIKAYLIDPSLGNQFADFTLTASLGQKSFYYEQTIPTYTRKEIAPNTAIKTGWGHFIYPVVTADSVPISYVQLSDALKTIYNGILFSQSTDNDSLKIDSSALLNWLKTDTTLKNASSYYDPAAVEPKQLAIPTPGFTEKNVLKDWLAQISNAAAVKGNAAANFLLSYDNIYWEPLNDVYNGDIYVNSPAMFMTRLATYYQAPGQSPVDEPGNFENPGGFIKARRKYFLSNLIQRILTATATYNPIDKNLVSPYLSTSNPEKFLGPKFFPYYKFRQYKSTQTNKELLDVITIPFSSASSTINVIECDTATDLKKVVFDGLNQYRRKIEIKPNALPTSLGYNSTERINTIGFVDYVNNDGTVENIQLNLNSAIATTKVFSFLTWIYMSPSLIGDAAQWTRNGRYFTNAKDLRSTSYVGYSPGYSRWITESLCTIMNSGMYDTPEQAYVEYKRVVEKITVSSTPSSTDPQWKDYYKCLPAIETTEDTIEYCDPSPSPDGRQTVKRIATQKALVAANGTKTLVGNPSYTYPSTTVILRDQTRVVNGKNVKGTVTIVYRDCSEVSNTFSPDAVAPTGPTGGTSPVVTGPGPNVDVALEDFINPAIFNRNVITLIPSQYPITLQLERAYYVLEFDPDEVGEKSSDYTIELEPGTKGQVVILEINTLGTRYKGVILNNNSVLANNNTNQRVRLSTEDWGDGGGQPFKSYLFMVYDGTDWVEFLRRDIY
jgi:hypothetical protein